MNDNKLMKAAFLSAGAVFVFGTFAGESAVTTEVARPVRSEIVQAGWLTPDLTFAGKVDATATRKLVFKQSGRIQRIPVVKGQTVKKGEKLAWLDPLDFENAVQKAEAQRDLAKVTYERKADALKKKGVSQQEVSIAETELKSAEAQLALARRALEETVLRAPFDGTIADVPGTELEMTSPTYVVVSVQDTSTINVDVGVPENLVIRQNMFECGEGGGRYVVTFDSLPGKSYAVSFSEFKQAADMRTQTYTATFKLKPPADLLLLPGMSATVTLKGGSYVLKEAAAEKDATSVRENAVGIGADGGHFVWTLTGPSADGVYRAAKRPVRILSRSDGGLIVSGLKAGERIATAGVSVLTEGRPVTLLGE